MIILAATLAFFGISLREFDYKKAIRNKLILIIVLPPLVILFTLIVIAICNFDIFKQLIESYFK